MSLGHWTSSRLFLVLSALTALAACGGKSGSNDDVDDDSSGGNAGSGGSSDAGSGGTGGATGGSGNSGGSDSTAGNSGGTDNTGGAGTTAGAGTGGASNTGGAGTTAGAGTGGEATSTTASMGGSGGTDPVPPPELVEGCQAACDAEVAAGCAAGPSTSSCADGCNLTTRVPACAERLGTFFDCVAEDDTTSCSNEDEVVFDACVIEQIDAYACVLQEAPDPDLAEPCENYCSAVVDAMCENDEGDLAGCVLWCQSLGTTYPSCRSPWQTLLECGETAEFECNANGEAEPLGCTVEALTFLVCICNSDPTVCE